MKHRLIFAVGIVLFPVFVMAQSTLDQMLGSIAKNNKTLATDRQKWEAQKLEFNTGLTPVNPAIEYDYLIGTPSNAGNQTDFTISQDFDFPTAYVQKKKLANEQSKQAEFYLTASRQNVLLEAKSVCIKLVFHNKLQNQLNRRLADAEKVQKGFQARLDKGDGNILDLNKANVQLIEVRKAFQTNGSEITQLNQKLVELNGGEAIAFTDTVYSVVPTIPPFEELERLYEESDPDRKILEQQKLVAEKNLSLSRALALPKLTLGYHYQGILGQTYNGVHAGTTIPLWENKNVLKQRKAEVAASDLEFQTHLNEHYFHIKHLYEDYSNLKTVLEAYESVNINTSSRNRVLLNKAFALGQLSSIEYFMETAYYYNALDKFLEAERDYQQSVAMLLKYQL